MIYRYKLDVTFEQEGDIEANSKEEAIEELNKRYIEGEIYMEAENHGEEGFKFKILGEK